MEENDLITVADLKTKVDQLKANKTLAYILAEGLESRNDDLATMEGFQVQVKINPATKQAKTNPYHYQFKNGLTLFQSIGPIHKGQRVGILEINEHGEPTNTESRIGFDYRTVESRDPNVILDKARENGNKIGVAIQENLKFATDGFIILTACNTGLLRNDSWVQRLANNSRVTVYAPMGNVAGSFLAGDNVKVSSFAFDGKVTLFGYYKPGTPKIQYKENDVWYRSTNGLFRVFRPK